MVLFYLILKAILKAGQLCIAGVAMFLMVSCSTDNVITPCPPEDTPTDSTLVDQDSIPESPADTIASDTLQTDTVPGTAVTDPHLVSFNDTGYSKEYWARYGKEDPVNVRKPGMDSEEWFGAEPFLTFQGFDIHSEQACMFSVDITPSWSNDFRGQIRLVYLDSHGKIIGQTYTQSISGNREQTFAFFDHLSITPQRIRIMPVVRRDGTDDWVCPVSSGFFNTWYMAVMEEHDISEWPDEDWGYTILPEREDRLSVRDMYNEGMSAGDYRFATNNQKRIGETFSIHYVLSNPSRKAVKGTLILRDEHGFSPRYHCYRPCQKYRKYDDREVEEWSREIGRTEIEIPAGSEGYRGVISGRMSQGNALRYGAAIQHLYFQPEGSSESYLLTKDWRHLLYALENGISVAWGANVAWIKVDW